MKTLVLAIATVSAATVAANTQTVIKEREMGNYSAPVAGATPQARENPSPGDTVLRERERTTVVQPSTTVIEQRAPSTEVEVRSRTRIAE